MKKTTLAARECISEAVIALGLGDDASVNELIDRLTDENYIPGPMAETLNSLLWSVGYRSRKETRIHAPERHGDDRP